MYLLHDKNLLLLYSLHDYIKNHELLLIRLIGFIMCNKVKFKQQLHKSERLQIYFAQISRNNIKTYSIASELQTVTLQILDDFDLGPFVLDINAKEAGSRVDSNHFIHDASLAKNILIFEMKDEMLCQN